MSFWTQCEQNATEIDRLSRQVTVTDSAHPLYGHTLPLVREWSPRGKTCLILLLPNGQHRSVPRRATNIDPSDAALLGRSTLPFISVRTMLPVAQFVRHKLVTTVENDHGNLSDSANPSALPASANTEAGGQQAAANAVEPVGTVGSATTGSTGGRTDLAAPARLSQLGGG